MNPQQVAQDTAAAQAQGSKLQNQYNQQSSQLKGQYGAAVNQTSSAYNNLLNYNKGMANPQQLYNQSLTNAQQMYGFNPQDLLKANQALANTNTTIANLPKAVEQQGNYYGTTAGAEAQNYANQAGNLQGVMAGQSNAANAFQSVLAATQNQANQSATLGLQGQQLKSQNYQALYQNSVSKMAAAGQTMASIEQLQQQQGNLTAQQVAAYRNAYSQYVSAQASSESANASMIAATAQARQTNQQVDMVNRLSSTLGKIYGGSPEAYATALTRLLSGNADVSLPTVPGKGGASSMSLGNVIGGVQGASGGLQSGGTIQ